MSLPVIMVDADFADVPTYTGGYTCSGDPRQLLSNLAKAHAFSYLVENDQLLVVRDSAVRKGDIMTISQFTGMEGIPKITERGVDVTTRLNAKAKIGAQFQIKSDYKTFNFSNIYFNDVPDTAGEGIYKTQRLMHSGDTHGDEYSTQFTGIL